MRNQIDSLLQVKATGKINKRSPRVVFGGPGKHKQAAQPAPLKHFEMMRPREVLNAC